MNKFEKISFEQFKEDFKSEDKAKYDSIKLPKRATKGSLGYDFYAPGKMTIAPGGFVIVNTGIKCQLDDDKGLFIFPRSGLGFKHKIHLANTIGVIDVDYYNNIGNEGHIKIKLCNGSNDTVKIEAGEAFAQGIILQYFTAEEDNNEDFIIREGGFGSTTAMATVKKENIDTVSNEENAE